jgi:hypothetical protein
VYYKPQYSVAELDILHARAGLGYEWMKSERREYLLSLERSFRQDPWENHAQFRTRSNRWLAGTKRNKPKHNWSKKKSGIK